MITANRIRVLIASLIGLALASGTLPTSAQLPVVDQPAQACDNPTQSISLFAERLSKNRIGYGRTPESARIPGPTITMTEGECIHVTLVNDTNVALSMHAHGVRYTVASDGTPHNKGCVSPGRSRTFVFLAHASEVRTDGTIAPGSAGYWHYHDHCVGTDHGTDGIKQGLFGALIVRRPDDPVPDKPPFVVVMSGTTINLKKFPKTPTFKADLGQRVEFVVIGHGELFHTFHLHGHRWTDNRTGIPAGVGDQTPAIDNKTVGPADSFGFQIVAGEGVGPGMWLYHCHVQGHSDAGMSGIFMVRAEEAAEQARILERVRRFRRAATHAHNHHR